MALFHKKSARRSPQKPQHKLSRQEKKAAKTQAKLDHKRKHWKMPYAPYKNPADVKYFFIMPILFIVATLCFCTSLGWHFHNVAVYKRHVMESAMPRGSELPLWGGTEKGKLTLGRTMLSKDGKTLAVEVKYDDDAHQDLSSFGKRYGLRLVRLQSQNFHPQMSYGLFGTDGSGVLTIHSKYGFQNQAFVVMLMDRGHLVSSEDLSSGAQTTADDSSIDDSVTAQLSDAESNSNNSNSSQNQNQRKKLPPIYYMRLNAVDAPHAKRNWSNDREVVEDLFIKQNLAKLRKQRAQQRRVLKQAKLSKREYEDRLKENPQDTTAQDSLSSTQSAIDNANQNVQRIDAKYDRLVKASIKPDILQPKQTHYKTYPVGDLNQFNGTDQN